MSAPRKGPDPNIYAQRALSHLRQAELELLEAIHPGNDPPNAVLLEVHAFVRLAILKLTNVTGPKDVK
ncbi:MAG: hypothetical protein ACRD5M_07740 [Candidatus Acidiferrales bacterium]